MENEYKNYYFYDYRCWSIEELYEMYKVLSFDKKQLFKDSMAHFILASILEKCNYDNRFIDGILVLARKESDRVQMCRYTGRLLFAYNKDYTSKLRRLFNLSGKLCDKSTECKMDEFINGENFLNNLVNRTLGFSYEKEEFNDLSLINYNFLSHDECLAIADNFVRSLRDEEMVFYDDNKQLKK